MPVLVDSRDRQDRICEVAAEIIDAEGLQGLTIRAIARRAGCSTSFVTDFFPDKRTMLLRVLAEGAARATRRIEAVLAADPADLLGCVEAYLPLDPLTRRDWKIYFAFWDMASSDASFADEQRRWQDLARDSFAAIIARRGPRPREEIAYAAKHLLVLVMGVSTQAVFDGATWSPASMRAFARREVDGLVNGKAPD